MLLHSKRVISYLYWEAHSNGCGLTTCCKSLVVHLVLLGLARTVFIHRIFGGFPAKNTVCTPYVYGSGQN